MVAIFLLTFPCLSLRTVCRLARRAKSVSQQFYHIITKPVQNKQLRLRKFSCTNEISWIYVITSYTHTHIMLRARRAADHLASISSGRFAKNLVTVVQRDKMSCTVWEICVCETVYSCSDLYTKVDMVTTTMTSGVVEEVDLAERPVMALNLMQSVAVL